MSLEAYVNQQEGKYIPVLEFVNNLYKEARPQVPLKKIVEHLSRQNLFTNLALYKKDGYDYFLVTPTGLLEFEASTEVVKSIYDSLDHNQIGITFDKDNLRAFKGFYFKLSDALRLYEYAKLNPPEVETVNSTVFKPDDNIVSFLGKYQRLLINYKLFTPDQIVCLMIDENPACISHDDKYHAHWDMVSNALDANQLTPINEKEQIKAEQVKTWLASCGFIYTGFNNKENVAYQNRIAELEQQLAEMTEKAVEANVKILDLTDKLENEELNSIIHNHSAHKFLLNDAQAQITQLTTDYDKAQAEIKELKKQQQPSIKSNQSDEPANKGKLQSIDWESMSEHIYPPELHLALMIWQRIYWDNELKDSHITSHNGKYEVIANKINLNPKSTLGKRVGMVINNAFTKNKQTELAEQLRAINEINMPQKI